MNGFTLVEMVVAIAILGSSLPVLYSIFADTLHHVGRDRQRREAVQIAQSLLAPVGVDKPLSDGEASGQFDSYRYVVTVGRMAAPSVDKPVVPYLVKVQVSWGAGPSHLVELQTLKLPTGVE